MKKNVKVIVEYSNNNLSAFIEGAPVITVGKDLKEVENNIKEAVGLYLETCNEFSITPVDCLNGELEFKFQVDVATFINYYSNIFTKAALSRITGINERQIWHYAAGIHRPRAKQLEKIQNGILALTKELNNISLL